MEAAETEKWTPRATFPYFLRSSLNRPPAIFLLNSRGENDGFCDDLFCAGFLGFLTRLKDYDDLRMQLSDSKKRHRIIGIIVDQLFSCDL